MKGSISSLFSIENKICLITGAAGQLGSALVTELLQGGAKVVALDTSMPALAVMQVKKDWPAGTTELVAGDIRHKSEVQAAFQVGIARFGAIDSLINNAGVSVFEPYLERPEKSIDLVMDVNIKGTIFCAQEFINHRISKGGDGAIVNIASHYGVISPDPRIYTDCDRKNSEIYGASKAGVIQMTKYYAVHAASHNIRVNAVSPGGVVNPENPQGQDFQKNYSFRCPMGRMAETQEIIGTVLFLLSPAASYITGHNLIVDGGMSCW